MSVTKTWYAHGKLLITGEYLVLDGARALAVPVNRGQYLQVTSASAEKNARLHWKATTPDGLWFQATYRIPSLSIINTSDRLLAENLKKILSVTRQMSPEFLNGKQGFKAETRLEFDTEFGFGSSSTLVANLAAWAEIDAFSLQRNALGGSGYDVACANSERPLFYQLVNGKPVTETIDWAPPFNDRIYFVYLGQKQRSDESIQQFKKQAVFGENEIGKIAAISRKIVKAETLDQFENLLREHEAIMSAVLGKTAVKERLFKGFTGMVKSLGAWGGDFVLVTRHEPEESFRQQMAKRGFNTIFSWNELVLSK